MGVIGDASIADNAVVHRLRDPLALRAGLARRAGSGCSIAAASGPRRSASCEGFRCPAHQSRPADHGCSRAATSRSSSSGANSGRRLRSIIANQPTWGLDIGAVAFVHGQLLQAPQPRCGGAADLGGPGGNPRDRRPGGGDLQRPPVACAAGGALGCNQHRPRHGRRGAARRWDAGCRGAVHMRLERRTADLAYGAGHRAAGGDRGDPADLRAPGRMGRRTGRRGPTCCCWRAGSGRASRSPKPSPAQRR